MKQALFATDGTVLVEASPRDRIWGIGLGQNNPKALQKRNWRGRNWLGYILTNVRDALMKEESNNGNPGTSKNGKPEGAVGGAPRKASGEKYTFFYRTPSPFSNWHPATFTVDGVEYNCTEQHMMHQKACKKITYLSLKKGNLIVPQKGQLVCPSKRQLFLPLKKGNVSQKGQLVCPLKMATYLSIKKGNLFVPQKSQLICPSKRSQKGNLFVPYRIQLHRTTHDAQKVCKRIKYYCS